MYVTTQTFWLPKAGNTEAEYEDAFYPIEATALPLNEFRCAIADGATETSFSKAWASLLARHWCDGASDLEGFLGSLPELQDHWSSQVASIPMAWYAEEKARAGAFSSLLGLTLFDEVPDCGWPARWEAVAVGDSCLFHVRTGVAFPIMNSTDFNNRPYLLSTVSLNIQGVREHVILSGGRCVCGDVFYLMTDALACWFLRRREEGQDISQSLLGIESPEMFARIVEGQRTDRNSDGQPYLRNDDVTLYRLVIHE